MEGLSHFESRIGSLSCTPEEVFKFVTDLQNFERFIPDGTITNWKASDDSCSFNVSMIGTISVRIADKEPCSRVNYMGDALKKNDFTLILFITQNPDGNADAMIKLDAELNPMLRMIANQPIIKFLELLVTEMEKFRGWKDLIK